MAVRPIPVNSTILGAAAEHFVMSQLLRRGVIAALAPDGVPNVDIVVTDSAANFQMAVQVKARRSGGDGGWHMKKKHEELISPQLVYCFVNFEVDHANAADCFIMPSAAIAEALKLYHTVWLNTPGVRGQRHNDTDMRRLLPNYRHYVMPNHPPGWLEAYRDQWSHIIQPGITAV